jgi:hypothetical protein
MSLAVDWMGAQGIGTRAGAEEQGGTLGPWVTLEGLEGNVGSREQIWVYLLTGSEVPWRTW